MHCCMCTLLKANSVAEAWGSSVCLQPPAQCFVLMRGATADTAGALRGWRQSREVIQPPNGLNFYSQLNDNLLAQATEPCC